MLARTIPTFAALVLAAVSSAAGPAVRYLTDTKLFVLQTERTSYVLGVNEQNDLVLKYVSHEIQGDTLVLRLQDIDYDLGVELVYRVFPRQDILAKQATIRNGTPGPVVVESAASGVFYRCPVREDYSADGNAWDYFTHDQSRSRACRWGEDGLGDVLVRITVHNRGPEAARLDLVPTLWFRNTWSWKEGAPKPSGPRLPPRRERVPGPVRHPVDLPLPQGPPEGEAARAPGQA